MEKLKTTAPELPKIAELLGSTASDASTINVTKVRKL
jgi:hypothetical protein